MHQLTKPHAEAFAQQLLHAHLNQPTGKQIKLEGDGAETLEALFLGTRGGNAMFLHDLLDRALAGHVEFRQNYFPQDPDYIDASIQNSPGFKKTMKLLITEYDNLIEQLQQSGTFFSMRTIGHMLWDTTIPGILGYFAALLYNQNNVAAEASPVTTLMEMEVGNELCKMLGYAVNPIGKKPDEFTLQDGQITGWGHITCDGSVANLEGLWMARNLKFFSVAVRAAIQNSAAFQNIKGFQVKLLDGTNATLATLDDWTVLNLPIDEVLAIPTNIATRYDIDPTVVSNTIANYTVQNAGLQNIMKYVPTITEAPVSMCSATRHYSWPKNAAILGIGDDQMWNIQVDLNARMDLDQLRYSLGLCLQKKIPLMNVIAIVGTTEESSVDPIKDIFAIRDEYRRQGLEFAIHCDAAWGGYFKTMLNSNDESNPAYFNSISKEDMIALPMSQYVMEQYQVLQNADSITIDPHKSGYIPYPAGGLCYRNSAMRNLVSFTAPVVYHGGVDPTVGVYGVEGSKPGAAASAVYFAHKVIRPNMDGYGKLSGECFFNAKRLYASLVTLNIADNLPFFIVPLIPIPAIQQNLPPDKVRQQYEFIRDRIVNVSNEQLLADAEAFALFKELGGDETIITYLYNFYNDDRTLNSSMAKTNDLNNAIYRAFSYKPYEKNTESTPIVVTSSSFTREVDGDFLINSLRKRLGVNTDYDAPVNFIISTIMNPWLSNTVNGSFIPQLMSVLIQNVSNIVKQVKAASQADLITAY